MSKEDEDRDRDVTPSDALKRRIRSRMNSGEAEIFYREHKEHRLYPFSTFNKELPPGSGTFVKPKGLGRLWAWVRSLWS